MKFDLLARKLFAACIAAQLLAPAAAQPEKPPAPYADEFTAAKNNQLRMTKEGELKSLLTKRSIQQKRNLPTDELDEKIARVKSELAAIPSGDGARKQRLERDLANYKRIRETYLKSGQDTSKIDELIEHTQRELDGKPLAPAKPASKPGHTLTEKVRQDMIESLKRSISSQQKVIDRYRKAGKPVPQMILDVTARDEAKLAELQK